MPTVVLAVLSMAAMAVVLLAPLRVGFVTVLAGTMLLPAPLAVTNPVTPYATVSRLLLIAMVVRLLLGVRSREVRGAAWRWTPVHSAFVVFLAAVFAGGVVLAT